MFNRFAIVSPIVASLMWSSACGFAAEPQVGVRAPTFELKGSDGNTYSLKDLAGKAVVIAWFPKAFTGGCTDECKSLKAEGAALREFDVAYFTASCDTVEDNRKFSESLGLDYPILSDPTGEVAKAFGVVDDGQARPRRWTFIIGADGKILHVEKGVKTKTHGKDIAAKLKELGVPANKG